MARTIDEAARERRRHAFLDAAEKLLQDKGFDAMTINDVVVASGASKGAFYHYFASKQELLEAVSIRAFDQITAAVQPIIDDDELTALQKLDRYIGLKAQWKARLKPLLLATARAWFHDEHGFGRMRARITESDRLSQALVAIVRQGNAEGVFQVADPEVAGHLVWTIMQDLKPALAKWIVADAAPTSEEAAAIRRRIDGYNTALERILAAPAGTIQVIDRDTFDTWFGTTLEQSAPTGQWRHHA